jgi:hypothetical protein
MTIHHGGPSAVKPQPNGKDLFTTKDTKSTKVEGLVVRTFVSFVTFVAKEIIVIVPRCPHGSLKSLKLKLTPVSPFVIRWTTPVTSLGANHEKWLQSDGFGYACHGTL